MLSQQPRFSWPPVSPARSRRAPSAGAPAHRRRRTDLRLTENAHCLGKQARRVGPKVVRRFHAVTAVSCPDGFRVYPGQGQWEVRIRKVAVSGIPAWQRYFEQRNDLDFPPKGGVCSLVREVLLVPVFVDGRGRTLVPRIPVDRCGEPLASPATPVRWHVVWVHRVRQLVSAAALAANCPMKVGNTVAWAGPPRDSTGGPLFDRAPKALHVCVYRTPADHLAVGYFVRGFRLHAARTRRLLRALTGPGPRRGCPKQRTFADVGAERTSATVELGGCFRVERPDRLAGTARPAVVRAILGGR